MSRDSLVANPGHSLKSFSNPKTSIFLAIVLALLFDYSVNSQFKIYILALCGLGTMCFCVRKAYLPSIALLVFCLCPVAYLSTSGLYQLLSPGNVVISIYLIKMIKSVSASTIFFLLSVFLPLILLSVESNNIARSFGWTATFIVTFLCTLIEQEKSILDESLLLSVVFLLSVTLGIYAIIEKIFDYNPLSPKYQYYLVSQRSWNSHRITTTLGHPINNGMVFCTLLLLLIIIPPRKKQAFKYFASYILCLIGIFLSYSRASIISLALAVFFFILLKQRKIKTYWAFSKFLKLSPIFALGTISLIQSFISRNSSQEGSVSFLYRFQLLKTVIEDIPNIPSFGYGPGLGSEAFLNNGYRTILENGLAQLIYGVGIYFFGLILCFALVSLVQQIRRRNLSVILYFPWITVFLSTNIINDNITSMTFLGILVIISKTQNIKK